MSTFSRDTRRHTSMIVKHDNPDLRDTSSFMTVPDLKAQAPMQHVMILGQLNNLIDNMDNKIQDVINRHEAEFLYAYRNHMTRVKEELEVIRSRAAAVEANSNSLEKISLLEKQLILFRQESLKLYDRLEDKTRECENLKIKLQEVGSQNTFLESEVKKLMKRVKTVQAQRSVILPSEEVLLQRPPTTFTQKPISTKLAIGAMDRSIRSFQSSRARSHYTRGPVEPIIPQSQAADDSKSKQLGDIKAEFTQPQLQNAKKVTRLNQKYRQLIKMSSYNTRVTSDLERYFLECVESVRRQIIRRKGQYTFNPDLIDFSVFRKADNMQVLEILVSHPRVRDAVYGEIFKQAGGMGVARAGMDIDRQHTSSRLGSNSVGVKPYTQIA